MTMHLSMGWRLLVVGLMSATLVASTAWVAGAQSCIPGCVRGQPSASCCPPCVAAACAEFDDCIVAIDDPFEECVSKIEPNGGHCEFTRDQLQACRARRAAWIAKCRTALQHDVPKGCSASQGFGCRISTRAARRACRSCGGAITPREMTTTTATTPDVASPRVAGGLDCQERCIRRVAQSCYEDCADACEGDGLALAICQTGCRTDQCSFLKAACTDNKSSFADQYRFCCTRAGDCADDVDCVATTTSTRTTTTKTTTTATTTTTL
jgi:hypothetical protein